METLPLDILLYIIDLLASGDDKDIKSLQILSQTCKYMVPPCRKHLFSSLNLHSEMNSERFSDLLSKNPDIALYVTSLSYRVSNPISDHELNILDLLKEHASLQLIQLSPKWRPHEAMQPLDWNDFPESIRSSLIVLIQLPTVTHLDISDFEGFPATAFSGCSNLIDLQLIRLQLAPLEVDQVISRSKTPTPVSLNINTKSYSLAALMNSASLHAGDPIVDFSCLEKAQFYLGSRDSLALANGLIKVTARLEYLKIFVYKYVGLAGLGASLAINAYRTLKILRLSFPVGRDSYEPLCGVSRELRFIAGKNILEMLELFVMVEDNASYKVISEEPSAFDSVLTESGAFPKLHRVSVEILWSLGCTWCLGDLNLLMGSLKENKFPRLVESKAVGFNFSSNVEY